MVDTQCRVCGRWCTGLICEDCQAIYGQAVPRCQLCALRQAQIASCCPRCEWRPEGVSQCVAVVSYEYPWRDVVAGLKYQGDLALAPWMATMALRRRDVQEVLARADWLLPMPLSLPRLADRGYNQAYEWARHLAPDKLARDWVLRLPTSLPQARLDKTERLAQEAVLRSAFVPHPDHIASLREQTVLLVDDVQTTGTTLHALAQVLLAAGVREVKALVFARAEVA